MAAGKKEKLKDLNPLKNYYECRTFHSLVYQEIRRFVEESNTKRKQTKLKDFLSKDDIEEEIKIRAKELFLKEYEDKKKAFEINFEKIKNYLELEKTRKKELYEVYLLLQRSNEEGYLSIQKIKEQIKKLTKNEVVFLVLLLEGAIYDFGYVVDPFKLKKVNDKFNYVVDKYYSMFDIYIGEQLKEVLDFVLSEDYNSPLHPVYNIRKFYETLINLGYSKNTSDYDIIIIDEAQDLPEVAFEFIKRFYKTKELILAGDPYQSIFLDLGFNSSFILTDQPEVMKTLYRYPREYLYFIKSFFYLPISVLDLIEEYHPQNKVTFERYLVEVPSEEKDPYLYIGLKVMEKIKNSVNDIFLTHNLMKYQMKQETFLILPYKDYYREQIRKITNYLSFLYLDYLYNNNQRSFDKFKTLIDYYNYVGMIDKLSEVYLKKIPKEEVNKLQSLKLEEKLITNYFNKNKDKNFIRELFKFLSKDYNKDFVISLSVHKSKGKTLKEVVHYIPTKGLYLFLEKFNLDYLFIHNMLKYVALTRLGNKLVYYQPIVPSF